MNNLTKMIAATRLQAIKAFFTKASAVLSNSVVFIFLLSLFTTYGFAQDTWTQKADFGGASRAGAVGFNIGDKGYIGTGSATNGLKKDLWQYDPVTDVWTQKADFGGGKRMWAVGLSVENKGYIGTGMNGKSLFPNFRDFWEYDPATNAWTKKADLPGYVRAEAVGFSIGSKGYVGTGFVDYALAELWEYDPAADTWTRKADFGGGRRSGAIGFALNGKGYIGTGWSFDGTEEGNFNSSSDFWEYDPASDNWTRKADYGGGLIAYGTDFAIGNNGYGIAEKSVWAYDAFTDLWIQKGDFPGAALSYGTVGFSIGDKGYAGTGWSLDKAFWEYTPEAQDNWTQKVDVGGTARHLAVGFSIAGKGYIGTGNGSGGGLHRDFWEYDPAANVWTQKSDFGGNEIQGAVGFSIGSKGYVGIGMGYGDLTNNFWEYDPSTNNWIQKADFEGLPRFNAIGFSIGPKGYVGEGGFKDFWEYDPTMDMWTQKTDFAGSELGGGVGFCIAGKGYIAEGGITNYFWEYDPVTDAWVQKANFGGTPRYFGAVGFSIGDKGYLGTGYATDGLKNDFWEYNPVTDTWIQKANFEGTARFHAVGFSISGKGFIGTGTNSTTSLNDFWEYTPGTATSCPVPTGLTTVNLTFNSAELTWGDVADAERYKVRYKVSNSSVWITVSNIKTNALPVSGLTPNTLYVWEVKSVCSSNPIIASEWSAKQSFTTGTFRIGDEQAVLLELYPNPVSENFTLDLQLHSSADQSADIFLLNELGQIVYSEKAVAGNGALKKEITMPSAASSGWYIVRVVLSDQVMERKLLYQK